MVLNTQQLYQSNSLVTAGGHAAPTRCPLSRRVISRDCTSPARARRLILSVDKSNCRVLALTSNLPPIRTSGAPVATHTRTMAMFSTSLDDGKSVACLHRRLFQVPVAGLYIHLA